MNAMTGREVPGVVAINLEAGAAGLQPKRSDVEHSSLPIGQSFLPNEASGHRPPATVHDGTGETHVPARATVQSLLTSLTSEYVRLNPNFSFTRIIAGLPDAVARRRIP